MTFMAFTRPSMPAAGTYQKLAIPAAQVALLDSGTAMQSDCLKDSVGLTTPFKPMDPTSKKLMAFGTSQLFTQESALHLDCFTTAFVPVFEPVPVLFGLLVYRHVLILHD